MFKPQVIYAVYLKARWFSPGGCPSHEDCSSRYLGYYQNTYEFYCKEVVKTFSDSAHHDPLWNFSDEYYHVNVNEGMLVFRKPKS